MTKKTTLTTTTENPYSIITFEQEKHTSLTNSTELTTQQTSTTNLSTTTTPSTTSVSTSSSTTLTPTTNKTEAEQTTIRTLTEVTEKVTVNTTFGKTNDIFTTLSLASTNATEPVLFENTFTTSSPVSSIILTSETYITSTGFSSNDSITIKELLTTLLPVETDIEKNQTHQTTLSSVQKVSQETSDDSMTTSLPISSTKLFQDQVNNELLTTKYFPPTSQPPTTRPPTTQSPASQSSAEFHTTLSSIATSSESNQNEVTTQLISNVSDVELKEIVTVLSSTKAPEEEIFTTLFSSTPSSSEVSKEIEISSSPSSSEAAVVHEVYTTLSSFTEPVVHDNLSPLKTSETTSTSTIKSISSESSILTTKFSDLDDIAPEIVKDVVPPNLPVIFQEIKNESKVSFTNSSDVVPLETIAPNEFIIELPTPMPTDELSVAIQSQNTTNRIPQTTVLIENSQSSSTSIPTQESLEVSDEKIIINSSINLPVPLDTTVLEKSTVKLTETTNGPSIVVNDESKNVNDESKDVNVFEVVTDSAVDVTTSTLNKTNQVTGADQTQQLNETSSNKENTTESRPNNPILITKIISHTEFEKEVTKNKDEFEKEVTKNKDEFDLQTEIVTQSLSSTKNVLNNTNDNEYLFTNSPNEISSSTTKHDSVELTENFQTKPNENSGQNIKKDFITTTSQSLNVTNELPAKTTSLPLLTSESAETVNEEKNDLVKNFTSTETNLSETSKIIYEKDKTVRPEILVLKDESNESLKETDSRQHGSHQTTTEPTTTEFLI